MTSPYGPAPKGVHTKPNAKDRERECAAPGCANRFVPRPSRMSTSKWCSRACANAAKRGRELPKRAERVVFKCQGPGCLKTFTVTEGKTAGRRTCSRACADALKGQEQAVSRRGAANPNYRGAGREGDHTREGDRTFFDPDGPVCRAPGCPGGFSLDQHHVVYRQEIRRRGAFQWDPDDALALCHSCHSSHHKRGRVLPLTALRDENYSYAVGLMGPAAAYEYLRRRYGGSDPRLDALLPAEHRR